MPQKTYEETLRIKQRYADLSVDHFKFLKRMQASKKIEDNKFAAQELSKAFIKMIPQAMEGNVDVNLKVSYDETFNTSSETKESNREPEKV